MLPRHSTMFETQNYHQNEREFKVIYSRNGLSNIVKGGAYIINLD